jgi:hypothetical protein
MRGQGGVGLTRGNVMDHTVGGFTLGDHSGVIGPTNDDMGTDGGGGPWLTNSSGTERN